MTTGGANATVRLEERIGQMNGIIHRFEWNYETRSGHVWWSRVRPGSQGVEHVTHYYEGMGELMQGHYFMSEMAEVDARKDYFERVSGW